MNFSFDGGSVNSVNYDGGESGVVGSGCDDSGNGCDSGGGGCDSGGGGCDSGGGGCD